MVLGLRGWKFGLRGWKFGFRTWKEETKDFMEVYDSIGSKKLSAPLVFVPFADIRCGINTTRLKVGYEVFYGGKRILSREYSSEDIDSDYQSSQFYKEVLKRIENISYYFEGEVKVNETKVNLKHTPATVEFTP